MTQADERSAYKAVKILIYTALVVGPRETVSRARSLSGRVGSCGTFRSVEAGQILILPA